MLILDVERQRALPREFAGAVVAQVLGLTVAAVTLMLAQMLDFFVHLSTLGTLVAQGCAAFVAVFASLVFDVLLGGKAA